MRRFRATPPRVGELHLAERAASAEFHTGGKPLEAAAEIPVGVARAEQRPIERLRPRCEADLPRLGLPKMEGRIDPFTRNLVGLHLHGFERAGGEQALHLRVHRRLVVPLAFQRFHDALHALRPGEFQAFRMNLHQAHPGAEMNEERGLVGGFPQTAFHADLRVGIAPADERLFHRGAQAVDLFRRRPLADERLPRRRRALHTASVRAGNGGFRDPETLPAIHCDGHIDLAGFLICHSFA